MTSHTPSAAAISGSMRTKEFQRSARLEMPALSADSDRSRSSPFSTVTTPVTRFTMASARAISPGLGTVPVSETTPSLTATSTAAKAGSSANMPEIRSAMRSSSPASCVAAMVWTGVGVAAGSAVVSSCAASGIAHSRASAASRALTGPPPTCRRCARSARRSRVAARGRRQAPAHGTYRAACPQW